MNSALNPSAAVALDWDRQNLLALQQCLRAAYVAVAARLDPERDPVFDNPNRAFMAGMMRWNIVDHYLWRNCDAGLLRGITPLWLPLAEGAGAMRALELRGAHTSVMAHHIPQPDALPRDSKLRLERRVLNERNPYLPTLAEAPQPETPLLNLLLVHGHKAGEFAFLRAYHSLDDPRAFIPLSENIMALAGEALPEAEEVQELELGLKIEVSPVRRRRAAG